MLGLEAHLHASAKTLKLQQMVGVWRISIRTNKPHNSCKLFRDSNHQIPLVVLLCDMGFINNETQKIQNAKDK